MDLFILIIAAVLPGCVLLAYIRWKDKEHPEPTRWIIKGFLYGVLSVFASYLVSVPLGWMGFYRASEACTISEALSTAFFGAGIPEEAAKLLMLWLLLRKNPYFDERIDGVVYAVCVGMGFASFENLMYLASNFNNWMSVGIMRAIISVPGHFMFAVAMGYYYSVGYWGHSRKHMILAFVVPMLLHSAFDSILMVSNVTTSGMATIFMFVFFYLFIKMRRAASDKISNLLAEDNSNPVSDEPDEQ